MRRPRVVVLAHGTGNVHSAVRALARAGAEVALTADRQAAEECDGLVLPGVGSFARVMADLRAVDAPRIIDRRLAGARAVLGICVGMQVMFSAGEERAHGVSQDAADQEPVAGLGQWPGVIRPLRAPVLPHMGWSQLEAPAESPLLGELAGERFYFVHSYACLSDPAAEMTPGRVAAPTVSWCDYGERFVAAVENGPLTATQFHPEKSGEVGAHFLARWIESLR